MVILDHFLSGPEPCEYLPGKRATLEYAQVSQIVPEEYERLMDAGWRKFGPTLFRPVCAACSECRPLRIPAAEFTPNRSQQRAWRKNADLEVRYAPPSIDTARLDLYRRYQASQAAHKGWPDAERTASSYRRQFIQTPLPSIEISIWEDEILRGVVIADLTPNAVSGVYHFHDPDCKSRSLGTFALLHTIDLARQRSKRWAYFGFYVADCPSMRYKAQFRPHEILGTDGVWQAE